MANDELVREGSPVVLLHSPRAERGADDPDSPYESIVFVPAGEGKKIEVGHAVEVSPATVKREEHGFIRGQVVGVSELPATKLAMEAALAHPELVDTFLKRFAPGVLLRVHIKLDELKPSDSALLAVSRLGAPEPLPLVIIVGSGAAAQDRHDVSGRDRRQEAKVDQPDPALDQDPRRGRLSRGIDRGQAQADRRAARTWRSQRAETQGRDSGKNGDHVRLGNSGSRRHRPVRTPTVLQMEAAECGAAALGIILEYHGRYVPLDVLRDECGVSRDGSNAFYVKEAAQSHGLEVDGHPHRPRAACGRTTAVHRLLADGTTFLVVEGFGRGKVYLNDPASGRRTRQRRTNSSAVYSGIVFTLEPGPNFRRAGRRPSALSGLARRLANVAGGACLRHPRRVGARGTQPGRGRASARVHRRDPGRGPSWRGSSPCWWRWP